MELNMADEEYQTWWDKNKKYFIWGAVGVTGLVAGLDSYKPIDSGHFGVHTRMGKVLNDTLGPGVETKVPFIDHVYEFQNNTIILTTTAGEGRNTKDQNMLSAEMRLHYTIDPREGVLALHIATMSDDNGKELLESLMDQSFNAVVGERPASDHMADPETLLASFGENLQWREKQNNVPISVDAIELLTIEVGNGTDPYRMPVQMRLRRVDNNGKAGWTVEQMAGPAALPVESGGKIVKPNNVQPTYDSSKKKLDTLMMR